MTEHHSPSRISFRPSPPSRISFWWSPSTFAAPIASPHLPASRPIYNRWSTNHLPPLWGGNLAKFLRKLTDKEIAFIVESAANYKSLAQVHATKNAKPLDQTEFLKVVQKKAN
ncbi:hypothetical protein E3N88_10887 [Mikania micrantha]|uniref:Uncharacterized protein n=1 Tax=Mikania micrantha TaxID=192012 RepID=A0A5N6PES9_9ASTR|nr:hypothetical protein E3N88_10887 [Mikania micrantha]